MHQKRFIIAAVCLFFAGLVLAFGNALPASARYTAPTATPFQIVTPSPSPEPVQEVRIQIEGHGFGLQETIEDE